MLALTAVSVIAVALITNVGGIRDKLYAFGQKVVEVVPMLKLLIDALGWVGGKAAELGKWLGFASDEGDNYNNTQTAMAMTTDDTSETMENQGDTAVVTTDTINQSVEEQIQALKDMELNTKETNTSAAAWWAVKSEADQEYAKQYALFKDVFSVVNGEIVVSDEDKAKKIIASTQMLEQMSSDYVAEYEEDAETIMSTNDDLTASHEQTAEILQQVWDNAVKKIRKSFSNMNSAFEGAIQEFESLMSKDKLEDSEMFQFQLTPDIVIDVAEWRQAGEDAMSGFITAARGGDFEEAIQIMKDAISEVPPHLRSNFAEHEAILNNDALNWKQQAELITTVMDINPWEPIAQGIDLVDEATARVGAKLDELVSVHMHGVTQGSKTMDQALQGVRDSLTEEQKALSLVDAALADYDSGNANAEKTLRRLEAAGLDWSDTLDEVGTKTHFTLEQLDQVIVDLGDGSTATFAQIGSNFVNLDSLSTTHLSQGVTPDVTGVGTAMEGVEEIAGTALPETAAHEATLEEETETNFNLVLSHAKKSGRSIWL